MTDERLKKAVGKQVKQLRLMKGLTQEDMMSYDFERRYFQRIEAGEVNISLVTLNKLAKTFGVKIGQLFDFE